jgi:hypothetical protein
MDIEENWNDLLYIAFRGTKLEVLDQLGQSTEISKHKRVLKSLNRNVLSDYKLL